MAENNPTDSTMIKDLSLPELASFVGGEEPPKPQTPLPGKNIPPSLGDVLSTIGQNPLSTAVTLTTSGTNQMQVALNLAEKALRDALFKP
jgi:hypothetical protein